jgi:hypothetical protein
MRLKTEKVLNDIETYLEETAELPWGTAHIILMEAQDQINSLQRQLDYKELTDEEITVCMGLLPKYNSEIVDEDLVKFARAILRKVQEK